ncbi:MAG: pyridoxal-phosphate dependent enzyme [Actinobacteria bacterium]|nr:pyridoxal-phosphate dependent enzyme [Actinomycetota bacterium]
MMNQTVPPPTEQQLEAARRVIAHHLVPTPTVTLMLRGRPVLTKMELFQPTGAFKVRGALAAIDAALRSDPTGAVIASSAGNHGLGIAHAAMLLGARATVVVPATASAAKVKKLQNYEIELIQHGNSYDDAQAFALTLAAERSIRFLSPFNDPDVVAGQSTVFEEMLRQAPELEHLVVSVGGGGLIAGCLVAREVHGRTDIRVTAVQPQNSSALYFALQGKTMAEISHLPTIADGLAGGGDDGAMTNAIVAHHQIPFVLVPEAEIRSAVRECVEQNGLVMEGSATASYAAITNNLIHDSSSRVGFIACGRNIAFDLLQSLLAE